VRVAESDVEETELEVTGGELEVGVHPPIDRTNIKIGMNKTKIFFTLLPLTPDGNN
jgi:hypothetical protein